MNECRGGSQLTMPLSLCNRFTQTLLFRSLRISTLLLEIDIGNATRPLALYCYYFCETLRGVLNQPQHF